MFFRSLAEEAKARSIAVILSGTGSDDTNGIKSIKENEGLIIVQSPESAKFDGMPRSALRTGLVDAMLSPQAIALEIQHIAEASRRGNLPLKTEKQINDDLLKKIISVLKEVSNINFGHYKQLSIFRRIERRMIVFSPHNVFQDLPFRRLNLISCRNLLTYFQPESQDSLLASFHTSLKNGGYLFLGQSENTGADSEAYPAVDCAAGIFAHRANVKIPRPLKFSNLPTTPTDIDYTDTYNPALAQDISSRAPDGEDSLESIDTAMLERFMPASFIINEKDELIRTYGQCDNFIRIFPGKVSRQLYDVLTENLKLPVFELLKTARDENRAASCRDFPVKGEREETIVSLTALPIGGGKDAAAPSRLCALVIADSKPQRLTNVLPYEPAQAVQRRIADLETKLNEAERVNDELRSANKAFLSNGK